MQVAGIRPPAVAGTFYPEDPQTLRSMLSDCLARAVRPAAAPSATGRAPPGRNAMPKALISPHAGYVYSGPVAASAYSALGPVAQGIK
ncbi:MAG: AmmeMemoRadiSam system protein B, partial [Gammaproteobacteria bacterium]